MGKKAARHAGAIVVPTHAVAAELSERLKLGDRVRVIGNGPSGAVRDAAADPDRVIPGADGPLVASGSTASDAEIIELLTAVARLDGVRLIVIDVSGARAERLAAAVTQASLDAVDITYEQTATPVERAHALSSARAFAHVGRHDGTGQDLIDALVLGLPIVHVAAPALVEIVAGAGIAVAEGDDFTENLAEAIEHALSDTTLRQRLIVTAQDRSQAFSWSDSADKIWQLHADL
jgi:glycosyltransferase involved in cell wall biosynthesis